MKRKIEDSNQLIVVNNTANRRMDPKVDITGTVYADWLSRVRIAQSRERCSLVIEVDENANGRLTLIALGREQSVAKLDNEALAIRIANTNKK